MSDYRPDRQPLVTPGAIDHHAADMTASFSADVTLAEAQETLARHEQWLPIDGEPSTTLGRLVETNSTGPLRLGYGAWRDLLLGAQFHNGQNDLITAGGRTVKNVAGYDLTKFMVGQSGIFGKLVTITTRAYKRPARAVLATHTAGDDHRAKVHILEHLLPTALRPQWALVMRDALLCGYLGDERTMTFVESSLAKLDPTDVTRLTLPEDADLRCKLLREASDGPVRCRIAVPPTRIDQVARVLSANWVADPAFGIIWTSASPEGVDELRRGVARTGAGSVVCRRLDGSLLDAPAPDPAVAKLLDRLKYAFDPDGRLVPLPLTNPATRA
ncbi:MAG: FAD-binding oxidoreductase [Tepidisphaeraceae bacterium]